MAPVDGTAALRALDGAGGLAEDAGRRLDDRARDLQDTAAVSARVWTGRAGARAARRIDDDSLTLQALSGVLLFIGDVLRVEGARLGRALQAAATAPDEQPVPLVDDEVIRADRALSERLTQASEALAEPDLGERARAPVPSTAWPRTPSDPARLAESWHRLDPITRQRLMHADPSLGAADGLPAADRDVLNRRRLDDLLDAGVRPADLGALGAHLDADPARMLVDVTADGRSVVSEGNPDRARQVVAFVPGTGSSTADVGRSAQRAAAVCRAAEDATPGGGREGARHGPGGPGCVAVTWQGYHAPDDVAQAAVSVAPAERYAGRLADLAAGLDAVDRLDGRDAPVTAVGYSYGSVVVGRAAATEQGLAVDRMVHVGSPGTGTSGLAEQRIAVGDSVRVPGDLEVVGVRSRWDPVPWWTLTGVLGGRPGVGGFGGTEVRVDVGDTPWPHGREHSRYFDEGTLSVEVIGDLVVDPPE